jgi:hypothetical protein
LPVGCYSPRSCPRECSPPAQEDKVRYETLHLTIKWDLSLFVLLPWGSKYRTCLVFKWLISAGHRAFQYQITWIPDYFIGWVWFSSGPYEPWPFYIKRVINNMFLHKSGLG